MESLISLLVSISGGLATNAIYDLATLQAKARDAQPNPLSSAIGLASERHPDPGRAREALLNWVETGEFERVMEAIRADAGAVTSKAVMASFTGGRTFFNPVGAEAYAETLVSDFLGHLEKALLSGPEASFVLSRRLDHGFRHTSEALAGLGEQLARPRTFLQLETFADMLRARHATGFTAPYTRAGWTDGTSDIQQLIRSLVEGPERVALISAPAGYGKTRLALQLGLWARAALGTQVRVVDPDRPEYAGHLHELPGGRTLILVDDAEGARLGALLDELAKTPGHRQAVKVVGFVRDTFGATVEQHLSAHRPTGLRLSGALTSLRFEESAELLTRLGVQGEEFHARIHKFAAGVPLFLILAAEHWRRGDNFYRLASQADSLDRYLDEALGVMAAQGASPQVSRKALGGLAILRRVHPEGERSLTLLAQLTGLPAEEVRFGLEAGAKSGLLVRHRGQYRFAYDLFRERVAVRFVTLTDACRWLEDFDFRKRGGEFSEVLRSVALLAFQGGEDLRVLIERFEGELPQLGLEERLAFAEHVFEPLLATHAGLTLHWGAQLIGEALPTVTRGFGSYTFHTTHGSLVRRVLEAMQPLAEVAALRKDATALIPLACSLGDPEARRAAIQWMQRAVTPRLSSTAPLNGITETLEVAVGWLNGPHRGLWEPALAVLERLVQVEVEDVRTHPDDIRQVHISRGHLSLEWRPYQELYARVQEEVRRLPPAVLDACGARIGNLLGGAISQKAFRGQASQAGREAVRAWYEIAQAMLPYLGALHGRAIAKQARWAERHGPQWQQVIARELLAIYEELPEAPVVRLLYAPPTMLDFRLEGDPDRTERATLARQAQHALAGRVAAEMSPEQMVAWIRRVDLEEQVKHLPVLVTALLHHDVSTGMDVFTRLFNEPSLRNRVASSLFDVAPHDEPLVSRLTEEALTRATPTEVEAILPFALWLAGQRGSLHPLLTRLAGHQDPRLRAVLARSWAVPQDELPFVMRAVLQAGEVDEELGRDLLTGWHRLGTTGDVPAELARAFLTRTAALSLEDLEGGTDALAALGRSLCGEDPLWLAEHVEQRARQADPLDWRLNEAEGVAALFSGPVPTQWIDSLLHIIWGWMVEESQERTSLYWIAPDVFRAVAAHHPEQASGFLSNIVRQADHQGALKDTIRLISQLPQDRDMGDLADEVFLRAMLLSVTPDERRDLCQALISALSSGTKFKEGDGAYPEDEWLHALAKERRSLALERTVAGHSSYAVVADAWRQVEQYAENEISRVIQWEQDLSW